MRVIQGVDSLNNFLSQNKCGILADTGFLYACADTDDRLIFRVTYSRRGTQRQQGDVPVTGPYDNGKS